MKDLKDLIPPAFVHRWSGPVVHPLIYALNGVRLLSAQPWRAWRNVVHCSGKHTADPIYWGGVAASGLQTLGFGTARRTRRPKPPNRYR